MHDSRPIGKQCRSCTKHVYNKSLWCSQECFCKDEGHDWQWVEDQMKYICTQCKKER